MNTGLTFKQLDSLSFQDELAILIEGMKSLPQVECSLVHRFAPGVYLREIFMPADTIVIGKVHKTEHFNILLRGACILVHEDGGRDLLEAPCTFVSKAGVQKVLYIIADTIWQTVHVTTETDLCKLEEALISPEHPLLSDAARDEVRRISQERSKEPT